LWLIPTSVIRPTTTSPVSGLYLPPTQTCRETYDVHATGLKKLLSISFKNDLCGLHWRNRKTDRDRDKDRQREKERDTWLGEAAPTPVCWLAPQCHTQWLRALHWRPVFHDLFT
jgi:hypothetical protein